MPNHFTTADADRLLGFADEFIEDWERYDSAYIDSDERERIDQYRRIRPLLAAAPRLLQSLQSVEVLIRLEMEAQPGTSLHRALQDIQAVIAEAEPVQPDPSKKQELLGRILELFPSSITNAKVLAEDIADQVAQFFYDPDRAIAHVWDIKDVQFVRPDLNDSQALQVLHHIEEHYDARSGLSWNSLEMWADDFFAPPATCDDE